MANSDSEYKNADYFVPEVFAPQLIFPNYFESFTIEIIFTHRVSIEGKSPYNEYHIVDSRRKIFPSNLMTFWATIWHA